MYTYNPLVSIIIPVYNGSNYLKEAIDSALSQTYKNIEIVVINDGSCDDGETERIALSYGDKVRYFYKENGGVATALNFGIEKMNGDYFSWLSHDDMYKPEKIEKEVKLVKSHGSSAIVFCDFDLISSSGAFIKSCNVYNPIINNVKLQLAIGLYNAFHGCTLLIPKDFFTKHGVFNPSLRYTQDYDMWFRFAEKETFLYLEESLVLSRTHELQDSKVKSDLCTKESDTLHQKLMSKISKEEIIESIKKPIDFLTEAFITYRNAGYTKTSIFFLKHLFDISNKDTFSKTSDILSPFLFKTNNKKKTEVLLKTCKTISNDNSKKKIVIFNNVWDRGGVERVLSILLENLTKKYSVILITADEEHKNEYIRPKEVIHLRIPKSEEQEIPLQLTSICVLLGADLFIGNPNFLPSFVEIYKLLHELNINSIALNHYSYFLPYHIESLNVLIENRIDCLNCATASVWLTSFSVLAYAALNDNAFCIPNPLTFDINKNETPFGKTIIAVGRFQDTLKRLDLILKTFKVLLKKEPEARLLLVGPYEETTAFPPDYRVTIGSLLKDPELKKDNIKFIGESESVERYYKDSSVLIMTSESEGFGMVLTEAASFGIPCVIFDVPGLEDIITDGENGFIVPFGDTEDMAEKIHLLISNKSLHTKMSKRSKEMAVRFKKENFFKHWECLLDIIESKREQNELNKALKNELPAKIDVNFLKKLSSEYEKNITFMMTQRKYKSNLQEQQVPNQIIERQPNKFIEIILIPYTLPRDFFRSLRDDPLHITFKKILNKISFFRKPNG